MQQPTHWILEPVIVSVPISYFDINHNFVQLTMHTVFPKVKFKAGRHCNYNIHSNKQHIFFLYNINVDDFLI